MPRRVSVLTRGSSGALTSLLGAATAVSLMTACGSSRDLQFRMYDTRHQAGVEIRTTDLVRTSARAGTVPGNPPALYFRLTDEGELKFRRLSRVLAKRGARLHAFQRMAIEIDGKVYARLAVDYKVYPDGLTPDTGFEISLRDLATARRLDDKLRSG